MSSSEGRGRMARLLAAGVCLLAFALILPLQAAWAQSTAKPKGPELIAVLDLEAVGASQAEATALTERLREVLLKSQQFVLVDRSQMKAVLDEQALQQTGCTDEQCAVQVGQILGVRKIVSGKAVRAEQDIWLLSVMMVDVETARTVSAESLRHRGEFFALLDRGVPELAGRLTAAVTGHRPGPDVPAQAKALKVALFPVIMEGEGVRRLRSNHPHVVEALEVALKGAPRPAKFAYSFYPTTVTPEAYERFNEQPQHDAVAAHTWRGDKEPDAAFIYRESRELGVDLVVLHKSTASPHSGRHFELYLFNSHQKRMCREEGTWPPGRWGLAMGDAFVKALGDCLAGGS